MNDIWTLIAEIASTIHPERLANIATRIATLNSPKDLDGIKKTFRIGADLNLLNKLSTAWEEAPGLSASELSAALRGASCTAEFYENIESIEMVWSGPSGGLVPSRHTEQVLLEVITSASDRLFIVSFVAYEVDSIIKALQEAIGRDVRVDILLESSAEYGGKVTFDSIKTIKGAVPSARVYAWKEKTTNKTTVAAIGAMHAKCAVSDGKLAFITSANLSRAAMERNMELGVLVRGGHLPAELHQHLESLVMTETVVRV
jgi:cardiolipin synthase